MSTALQLGRLSLSVSRTQALLKAQCLRRGRLTLQHELGVENLSVQHLEVEPTRDKLIPHLEQGIPRGLDLLRGAVVAHMIPDPECPLPRRVDPLKAVKGRQGPGRRALERGRQRVVAHQAELEQGVVAVVDVVRLLDDLGPVPELVFGQHGGEVELVPDLDLLALHHERLPARDAGRVGDLGPEERARGGRQLLVGASAAKVGGLGHLVAGGDDVGLLLDDVAELLPGRVDVGAPLLGLEGLRARQAEHEGVRRRAYAVDVVPLDQGLGLCGTGEVDHAVDAGVWVAPAVRAQDGPRVVEVDVVDERRQEQLVHCGDGSDDKGGIEGGEAELGGLHRPSDGQKLVSG